MNLRANLYLRSAIDKNHIQNICTTSPDLGKPSRRSWHPREVRRQGPGGGGGGGGAAEAEATRRLTARAAATRQGGAGGGPGGSAAAVRGGGREAEPAAGRSRKLDGTEVVKS